jgi:glycosyltransferase involved in cell wall biosynthesis
MTPGDAVPIQKMVAEVVSVVIPTYNAEPYIVGTLFSVLRQRHPGLVKVEILVVDDNSTDGTLSAVETIAASYPGEIRVIRQQRNCGPAVARNRGLRDATGDFICFLDADDQYVPGFFAFCVEVLHRQPDAAAIVTGVELVNCHRPVDPVLYEALVASIPSNVLLRTSVARLLGGFPEADCFRGASGWEDIVFKSGLFDEFTVLGMKEKVLRYFVRPGSHFELF